MTEVVTIFIAVPLLLCLAMAVMWVFSFSMRTAMRIALVLLLLLSGISLQVLSAWATLINYRTGHHYVIALGMASEIMMILGLAKQLRDFRKADPFGIVRLQGHLFLVGIAAAAGLFYAAWAAIEFRRTQETTQLGVAVIGTPLVALCAWAAIRACMRLPARPQPDPSAPVLSRAEDMIRR